MHNNVEGKTRVLAFFAHIPQTIPAAQFGRDVALNFPGIANNAK